MADSSAPPLPSSSRSALFQKLSDLMPDAPSPEEMEKQKQAAADEAKEKAKRAASGGKTKKSITVPIASTDI